MNINEIEQAIENMTDAELEAALNAEIPAELEKEASVKLASQELADAFYAYGGLLADKALSSVDGVEKIASEVIEEFDAAEAEISQSIEQGIEALGIEDAEDDVAFHKEAQAAAAIIFQGYTDFLEKEAGKKPGAVAEFLSGASKSLKKARKSVGEHADNAAKFMRKKKNQAVKFLDKHKGTIGAGAAGVAAGSGAAYAKHHMDKKASELTVAELTNVIRDSLVAEGEIMDGVEKLASKGAKKGVSFGKKIMKHYNAAKNKAGEAYDVSKKHLGKHKSKYMAGGVGAAAGYYGTKKYLDRE